MQSAECGVRSAECIAYIAYYWQLYSVHHFTSTKTQASYTAYTTDDVAEFRTMYAVHTVPVRAGTRSSEVYRYIVLVLCTVYCVVQSPICQLYSMLEDQIH